MTSKVEVILADLPDQERQALVTALGNPRVTGVQIARALSASGHRIDPRSVQRWRQAAAWERQARENDGPTYSI